MVQNSGNAYRTRGVVVSALVLIAIAVGLILYGALDVAAVTTLGVVVIIIGIAVFAVGATYSTEPDKFGPSEQMYRVAAGLFAILIGIVLILLGQDVNTWVTVAVLIIGIALIGLASGLINSRKSKF